jgi:GTP pyrophosphokinase
MIRYEDLAEKVSQYHPAALELIQRGYVISAKFHKGQVRMNGEPYLTHPLEVANILAELKLDATTVTAGLLHDVLEDTLVSPQELRKQFGTGLQIVDGVTKISQVQFTSRHEKRAENCTRCFWPWSAISGFVREACRPAAQHADPPVPAP